MIEQILTIIFPVFALVFIGFLVANWQKPDFKPINRVNMDVLTPALVFSSLATMPLNAQQIPLIYAALIAILVPGLLMIPICYWSKLNFKAWAPPHMFRNSGNLAIPIFTYTFGDIALAPAVLLFVISTCTHISLGLTLLSNGNPFKQVFKMPIFLAAVTAMIVNLSNIELWQPFYNATTLLGQAAIPLMLLSLGSQMRFIQLSGLKAGVICTVQSLVTGATSFLIIYWLVPLTVMELQMMVLFSMLPPAVMNYLFAERLNIEPKIVASMVLFTNFFSLFTLPAILLLALSIGSS